MSEQTVTPEQIQDLAAAVVEVLWPTALYPLRSSAEQHMRDAREQMIVKMITAILTIL
jgi:hypothetical protein